MSKVTSLPQVHPIVGTRPELDETTHMYPHFRHDRERGLKVGKNDLEKSYENGDFLRVVLLSVCLCEDLVRFCSLRYTSIHEGSLWTLTKDLQRKGDLNHSLTEDLRILWKYRTRLTHYFQYNPSLVSKKKSQWCRDVFQRTWNRLGG